MMEQRPAHLVPTRIKLPTKGPLAAMAVLSTAVLIAACLFGLKSRFALVMQLAACFGLAVSVLILGDAPAAKEKQP